MSITISTVTSTADNQRTSFWRRTFDGARTTSDWFEVPKYYTAKTAKQIASDIRCSAKRSEIFQRTRGIRSDETWQARWEPATGGADGDCRVFIRFVGADHFPGNERFATAG